MKVAVSGGFDPLHVGHIRMFREAAEYGNLYIIMNRDHYLLRKKGFVFMPYEERKEIVESIAYVYDVIDSVDKDDTVCATLEKLKPDIFCNGGDRVSDNVPEVKLCKRLGIEMKFNIGGGKIQSSSDLAEKLKGVQNGL